MAGGEYGYGITTYPNANFRVEPGNANCYRLNISDPDGSGMFGVYENGSPLSKVDTIALVQSTAGSFCLDSTDILVHPSDSSNLTTNGKVYTQPVSWRCDITAEDCQWPYHFDMSAVPNAGGTYNFTRCAMGGYSYNTLAMVGNTCNFINCAYGFSPVPAGPGATTMPSYMKGSNLTFTGCTLYEDGLGALITDASGVQQASPNTDVYAFGYTNDPGTDANGIGISGVRTTYHATSIADCQAHENSYYWSANVLYLHQTGGGDPSGKSIKVYNLKTQVANIDWSFVHNGVVTFQDTDFKRRNESGTPAVAMDARSGTAETYGASHNGVWADGYYEAGILMTGMNTSDNNKLVLDGVTFSNALDYAVRLPLGLDGVNIELKGTNRRNNIPCGTPFKFTGGGPNAYANIELDKLDIGGNAWRIMYFNGNDANNSINFVRSGNTCGVIVADTASRFETAYTQGLNLITWAGGYRIQGTDSPPAVTKDAIFQTGTCATLYENTSSEILFNSTALGYSTEAVGHMQNSAWAVSGADRSSTATATIATGPNGSTGYKTATSAQLITDIQNIINGTNPNYGWNLERTDGQNDSTYCTWATKEGSSGQRPYIVIVTNVNTYTIGSNTGNTGSSSDAEIHTIANTLLNYGSKTTMEVSKYNTAEWSYALLKFDLSSIGSTETVSSATIYLYRTTGGTANNQTITLKRCLRNWLEGTQNGANRSNDTPYSCCGAEFGGGLPWSSPGGTGE